MPKLETGHYTPLPFPQSMLSDTVEFCQQANLRFDQQLNIDCVGGEEEGEGKEEEEEKGCAV